MNTTHEQFIHAVRLAAIQFYARDEHSIDENVVHKLQTIKLVYGRGTHGLRGQTVYNAWKHEHDTDLIEICALGEESWVQLAGTTIHELAHAYAGWGAGHDKQWKAAAARLGLRRVHAAGTEYRLANFHPYMRELLALMPKPCDGSTVNIMGALKGTIRHTIKGTSRVCTAGIGTKGGKSRGAGSGSRLRKYVCTHGQIVRASTDTLNATCVECNSSFVLQE